MRVQKSVSFPLSKAIESKIRIDYKTHNGLAKNANMEAVYRNLGIFNKGHAYAAMVDLYNRRIQTENSKFIEDRTVVKNEKAKAKRQTIKRERQIETPELFIIHLEVETTYKQDYYETGEKKKYSRGNVVIRSYTTSPEIELPSSIPWIINERNRQDTYKIEVVSSSRIEIMNTQSHISNVKPKKQHRMKRSYILRNDWLTYAGGIAHTAYQESEDNASMHNLLSIY